MSKEQSFQTIQTEMQDASPQLPASTAVDGSSEASALDTTPSNTVSNKYNPDYF